MGQTNSVIVKINMEGSESDPKFVVEEVTAQPGLCFEGAENLLQASFECLCCKTGYVVLPLITKTASTRTEMEVSIAEYVSAPNQEIIPYKTITLTEAIESNEEHKQGDVLEDSEMEAELFLREDSFKMALVENQDLVDQIKDLAEGDFVQTHSELSLDEVVNSHVKQEQDDELGGSEMKNMNFSMDVDPGSVETPPEKNQVLLDQSLDSEEYEALTSSEELSLKMQCLQSKVVIRLVRVDVEAREVQVAPIEPQERNAEGSLYQCDICKAFIKIRYNLCRHLNIHKGIRISCSDCPKSFTNKSNLAKHKKRFHQDELRICELCDWSNTCTKTEYHSHLRRQHPEHHIKDFRPLVQNFNGVDFPCIYCEPKSIFKNFEELKDHLKDTHGRNFACTRCPKACTTKIDLNRHIDSIHENF